MQAGTGDTKAKLRTSVVEAERNEHGPLPPVFI